jgi:hypothetical protein
MSEWDETYHQLQKAKREPLHAWEPLHTYLSTACFHGIHAECRKGCKFCGEHCICLCHNEQARR